MFQRIQSAKIFLLATVLLLGSCGFQLRNQANLGIETIEVIGMDSTNFKRYLSRYIQVNGVQIVEKNAQAQLLLLGESSQRNVVTFSATGRAREVEVVYQIKFSLRNPQGEFLIADTTLTQARDMTYDDDQILGKEAEERRLYQEMEQDSARQILNQVSARLSNSSKQ